MKPLHSLQYKLSLTSHLSWKPWIYLPWNLSKSFNSGKLENLGIIANSRCSERDLCARTSVKLEKFCKMLLHAQRSWRFPEIFSDFADFLPGQVKTFKKMVRMDRPGRDGGREPFRTLRRPRTSLTPVRSLSQSVCV